MQKTALDEIMPQVYAELHRVAAAYMRNERDGHTLQRQRWSMKLIFD